MGQTEAGQRSHDHHGRTKADLRAIDRTLQATLRDHAGILPGSRQFYEDFSQTTDEEVRELFARAAQRS